MDNNKTKNLLEKIENIIGYILPDEFKNFYLNNNLIINNVAFLSLEEIYEEVCDAYDDNEQFENLFEIKPEKTILGKNFDKKRVPFITDYAGNYIGMDFHPDINGRMGQIINYGADEYKMEVLSNGFKDFINGLQQVNIKEDMYITDYLFENNLNFRENNTNFQVKKIDNNTTEEIHVIEEKKNEITLQKEIKFEHIKEVIKILSGLHNNLISDEDIKIYKNYWFYLRIINKKDSLSRTMETVENFYIKLSNYNIDEIKGFSFAITNYIEEIRNNKIYIGEEKIYVEINISQNQILISYRETIKNKTMFEAYNRIIDYINNI